MTFARRVATTNLRSFLEYAAPSDTTAAAGSTPIASSSAAALSWGCVPSIRGVPADGLQQRFPQMLPRSQLNLGSLTHSFRHFPKHFTNSYTHYSIWLQTLPERAALSASSTSKLPPPSVLSASLIMRLRNFPRLPPHATDLISRQAIEAPCRMS